MPHALMDLRKRHLCALTGGQVAVCSAHPQVLMAAADRARKDGALLLVETTANQVNLSGGYTGMTPADFAAYMMRLAQERDLGPWQMVIGADHLGPHIWRQLPSAEAMARARSLAQACAAAGFRKFHLDTATGCADDPSGHLPPTVAAQRAAALCQAIETSASTKPGQQPVYTIGTDVPAPGGSLEAGGRVVVTDPRHLSDELELYEKAFRQAGMEQAWQRVLAIVVQPGVDFDDFHAAPYASEAALSLSLMHERLPGIMTFEIHSADYQSPVALRHMIRDHFFLLKIGPCLTFALREALFALAHIEDALPGLDETSNLIRVMEQLMQAHPTHWRSHYAGAVHNLQYLRKYSLRDRIRYYWSQDEARRACQRLMHNLQRPIPQALIRQFLPDLSEAVTAGALTPTPQAIIQARIQAALTPYTDACRSPAKSQHGS